MGKFSFGLLMVLLVSLLSAGSVFAQTPAVKCGLKTVLQWAPNTETDLANYKVYTSDVQGDLVDVTRLTELAMVPSSNPTVNGKVQMAILMPSLVPEVDNFFVVTASDIANNESVPSAIVGCDNNQVPGQVRDVTIINLP